MATLSLFRIVILTTLVVMATAFPGRRHRGFASKVPRLFQAACMVKSTLTGEVLKQADCMCGDQVTSCDVGPIVQNGMEMTFCNKLDNQTVDDLYIMQFTCESGVDDNCGPGTFCDIGPLNIEGTDYYICRRSQLLSIAVDTTNMCQPVGASPTPGLGLGQRLGRPRRGRF